MAQKHYISCIEHPMTVATTEQGPHKRYRRLRFPSFDADVWANKNPLLQKGELGHEKDTGRFKVGDGVTYWLDLPYNSVGDPAKVNGYNVLEIIAGKNVEIEQSGNVLTIGASGVGYSKQEIDDKFTVANAQIDANAVAIAKTRDDYMSADTDIMTIINNHAEELTTLHNDIDELGDDVAGIQAKIPESTSETNPLINKQQLLDEEMDIRDDVNEMVGELQTQITAQAAAIATLDSEKLDKNQGSINAGKVLTVGEDGLVVPTAGGTGGGLQAVSHDSTLSGAGTDTSPLGLAEAIKDEIADKAPKETVEALTQIVNGIIGDYVKKSGDTMTGGLTLPELTVRTAEGEFSVSVVAGVVTIATNNGLDVASHVKFDHAPTTDDNTTWANALDTSLVRKAQVAAAISSFEALPDQTGNAGKFLKTDGSEASWEDVPPSVTITLKEYDE